MTFGMGGGRCRRSELGAGASGALDQVSCLKAPFIKFIISSVVGWFPFR